MNIDLEKYYSRTDTKYTIGICLLVLSFFCIWLGMVYNRWVFLCGVVLFAVGIVIFLIGSATKVDPDLVDHKKESGLLDFCSSEFEDTRLAKRMSVHLEPTYVTQYDFEGENLLSRRAGDGTWRTSYVSAFRIFYLHDGLLIATRNFSIIDDSIFSSDSREYKYDMLGKAELIHKNAVLESNHKKYNVKYAMLSITDKDGNSVLMSQLPDDITAENIVQNINRLIKAGMAN